MVIVFSGDGGFNEALNGLEGDVPVGFLPGGGTSVLPRALGLPSDPWQRPFSWPNRSSGDESAGSPSAASTVAASRSTQGSGSMQKPSVAWTRWAAAQMASDRATLRSSWPWSRRSRRSAGMWNRSSR